MTRHPYAPDRGTITAETAVVLPVLVLVTVLAAWTLAVAGARLACWEGARAGARAAARGESDEMVVTRARAGAGRRAAVRVRRAGDAVVVTVELDVPGPPGLLRRLVPGARVAATVEAAREPGGPVA